MSGLAPIEVIMRILANSLVGVWAVLSVWALGHYLHDAAIVPSGETSGIQSELEERLDWTLLILNFPISIGVASVDPSIPGLGDADPVSDWCIFSIAGMVQWIVVVPWLVAVTKRKLYPDRRDKPKDGASGVTP